MATSGTATEATYYRYSAGHVPHYRHHHVDHHVDHHNELAVLGLPCLDMHLNDLVYWILAVQRVVRCLDLDVWSGRANSCATM